MSAPPKPAQAAAERPLPTVSAEARPFWEAARRHELALQHCQACGAYVYYPRALCNHCHSDRLEWRPVSGEGVIYSYTVCHRPAGAAFKERVPYVVALIDLKEGPRMLTNILTDQPGQVRIGRHVRVAFEDLSEEISLPQFVLAD